MRAYDVFLDEAFSTLRKRIFAQLVENYDLPGEHLKSFNEFVLEAVPEIIRTLPPAITHIDGQTFTLRFSNPKILTPRVEEDANIHYLSPVYLDVHVKQFEYCEYYAQALDAAAKRKPFTKPLPQSYANNAFYMHYGPENGLEEVVTEPLHKLKAHVVHRHVWAFNLPTMLFSAICNLSFGLGKKADTLFEVGGNFLPNGGPKVVPPLSRLVWNTVHVIRHPKFRAVAECRCIGFDRRAFSTANVTLQLGTESARNPFSGINITVALPFLVKPVALGVLFLALGWDKQRVEKAMKATELGAKLPDLSFKLETLFRSVPVGCTRQRARAILAALGNKYKVETDDLPDQEEIIAQWVIDRNVFPHVKTTEAKAQMLISATTKLWAATSSPPLIPFDNRDHLASKRFDTVGMLLTTLLRQVLTTYMDFLKKLMKNHLKKLERITSKALRSLVTLIDPKFVSSRMVYAIITGKWSAQRAQKSATRSNVCQPRASQSFRAIMSHLTKTSSSVNAEAKQKSLRDLMESGHGRHDPGESPEGKSAGLVNQHCFGVRFSCATDPTLVFATLQPFFATFGFSSTTQGSPEISNLQLFIEEAHVGYVEDVKKFSTVFYALRSGCQLSPEVSLQVTQEKIRIWCCGGRMLRPVLCIREETCDTWAELVRQVKDGRNFTPSELENSGLLEYVDAAEQENLVVVDSMDDLQERLRLVPDLDVTHIEVDPTQMFGLNYGQICYSNHNQVTRNGFQSLQMKQAMDGNTFDALQAAKNSLDYVQRPLVSTSMTNVVGGLGNLCTQQCVIMVGNWEGGNQEDNFIVSQNFVDFGGGSSTLVKPVKDDQHNQGAAISNEQFEKPDPEVTVAMQLSAVDHLLPNGLAKPGTVVTEGMIVIGKTAYLRATGDKSHRKMKRCKSTIHRGKPAVVDQIVMTTNHQGEQSARALLRQLRVPQAGDKFTSLHSNKGVSYKVVPTEDMPFSIVTGIVPDMVINNAAPLNRRIVGELLELLYSKGVAIDPTVAKKYRLDDATAFEGREEIALREILLAAGLTGNGKEVMACGRVGKIIEMPMFVGIASRQKLVHMVDDKIYCAYSAQKTQYNRYGKGRAKDGALGLGGMEEDVLAGYGASNIQYESYNTLSANCTIFVCQECSLLCDELVGGKTLCRVCELMNTGLKIKTTEPWKQFVHQMGAINVLVPMDVRPKPTT